MVNNFRNESASKMSSYIFWMASQALIKAILALALVKFLALKLSLEDFYIYSQFQYAFLGMVGILSTIPSSKYVALLANCEDLKMRANITRSMILLVIIFTLISTVGFAIYLDEISLRLGLHEYRHYVLWMPVFASFGGIFSGVLAQKTAKGDGRNFSRLVILSTLVSTAALSSGVFFNGIFGVLVALLITPCITVLICFLVRIRIDLSWNSRISRDVVRSLCGFSGVSVILYFAQYSVTIDLRADYAAGNGKDEAGVFLAAMRLSELYMGMIAAFLSNRLLLQFSKFSLRQESVLNKSTVWYVVIPLALLLLVFTMASPIISIVYGQKYEGAVSHIRFLLLADGFKCLYWIYAYFLIAKGYDYSYLSIELLGLMVFYFVAIFGVGELMKHSLQFGLIFQNISMLTFAIIRSKYNASVAV